jgi:hypothetical protein
MMTAPEAPRPGTAWWRLPGRGLLAAGVSVTLYAAGRLHQPDYTFSLSGGSRVPSKALLATIALGLAAVQCCLRRGCTASCPCRGHRAGCRYRTGLPVAALPAVTVPVAGCLFYGAFAAKVLAVQSRRLPGCGLPVAGGTLAVVLGVLWYTSALWYYDGHQLPRV